jgi:predicted small metal-binding protein
MAKVMKCRDVGFDCDAVVRADTEDDVLAQAAAHAQSVHGVEEITPEIEKAVRAAILEE